MSDKYSTTDEIRAAYFVRKTGFAVSAMSHYPEFDRWLAEVERAAAEKAWWEACLRIADGESNLEIADTYQKQNPYLEEKPNG